MSRRAVLRREARQRHEAIDALLQDRPTVLKRCDVTCWGLPAEEIDDELEEIKPDDR